MPFDNDGVISWELMIERINSDLANVLGNLVNRTISMSNKYFGGVVCDKGGGRGCGRGSEGCSGNHCGSGWRRKMADLRVADAITEIFTLFKRCNKYIDETMPWVLAKDEEKKDRLSTVLYNLVESISIGATLLKSFMPETSEKILAQLNAEEIPYDDLHTFGHYENGNKVTDTPEILFVRLKPEEVMAEVEKRHPAEAKPEKETSDGAEEASDAASEEVIDIEAKPEITFEDFGKMQFQVGEIIACEAVPKSKKLPVFPGQDRKPGKADCVRNPQALQPGGNGGQEGHGACQPETCQACRRAVRGYASVCRGC